MEFSVQQLPSSLAQQRRKFSCPFLSSYPTYALIKFKDSHSDGVNVDAVILCGGRGRRIADYIGGSQKCMIRVGGRPIIQQIFEHLESAGVNAVYFITGYMGQEVEEHFKTIKTTTRVEFLNDEGFDTPSTSRALLLAERFIDGDFLYSQGEILYDRSLIERLYRSELGKRSAVVALSDQISVAPTHPRVYLSGDCIEDISFNPIAAERYPFSYIGVNKLSRKIFQHLRAEASVPATLQRMIRSGELVGHIIYEGQWTHIAVPEDLERIRKRGL